MMSGWGPFAFVGGILNIVFWIFIILLVVRLIRGMRRGNWGHWMHDKSALDILKERYAKGEINKEEYEEKKKDLM
jgi:putative membrane protein